jgi:large subunit ribosomal protein L10
MARSDKEDAVAELAEEFRTSSAAVLTEYRGLTVAQITALRRSLKGVANYAVTKNTLTKIAAREAGIEGLDDLLTGPTAIAFIKGDPVEGAKSLKEFAKDNALLVLKAGYMDGRILDAADIKKLADLESREVLLAKLAGAMKASMSQAAALFVAPLSQAARTVEALRVKAEADPSVIGGAGAAPESVAEKVEEAVAEVVDKVEEVVADVVESVEEAVEGIAHKVEEALHHGVDETPESTTETEG